MRDRPPLTASGEKNSTVTAPANSEAVDARAADPAAGDRPAATATSTAKDPSSSLPASAAPAAGTSTDPAALPAPAPASRVHVALIVAQVLFGGFHVVGKVVLAEVPPLALTALRIGLAAPLLVVFAWRHDRILPPRRFLPYLALLGGLGIFGNQVLFALGLQRTTAINASIMMPSLPVFAVAAGALLGVETVGRRRLLGIALSVAGALVLVDPRRLTVGSRSALGNCLILCACLCYGTFLVVQRPLLRRLPWRTVAAWSFVFGALAAVPVGWKAVASIQPSALSATCWLGIGYTVVFGTAISHTINFWAVRRSSPTLVAAYSTLQPVVATALAVTFLGESLGGSELLGFVLIGAGLWCVSAAVPPAAPPTAASS
jgi:drug/metabolite transporter (DMT)-like permease